MNAGIGGNEEREKPLEKGKKGKEVRGNEVLEEGREG